eukprot:TRINITY_DN8602_c0_g1_i1.p2 TRINITY_DN8602_c0_g1~~TRINITY_DN8602_c0_g1_i1.p2  ORF type:complete len:213 (-),score=81.17 TRINITY_DN8602_c0_g1_i1:551-1189(-)
MGNLLTPRAPVTLDSFAEPTKPPLAPGPRGASASASAAAFDQLQAQQQQQQQQQSQQLLASQAPPLAVQSGAQGSTAAPTSRAMPAQSAAPPTHPLPAHLQHQGGGALPPSLQPLPSMRPPEAGAPLLGGHAGRRLSAGGALGEGDPSRGMLAMNSFASLADVPVAPLAPGSMLAPAGLRGGLHPMYMPPYGQPAQHDPDGVAAAAAAAAPM